MSAQFRVGCFTKEQELWAYVIHAFATRKGRLNYWSFNSQHSMLCESLSTPSNCKGPSYLTAFISIYVGLDGVNKCNIFSNNLYVTVNIWISSKPKSFCPTDISWSLCALKKLFYLYIFWVGFCVFCSDFLNWWSQFSVAPLGFPATILE